MGRGRGGQKLESKGLFAVTPVRGLGVGDVLSVCVCVKRACVRACVRARARARRGRLTIPDILVALRMR